MKAITCLIGLFLLFLASPAKAQSDGDEIPWSINSRNKPIKQVIAFIGYRKLQPNGHLFISQHGR